MDLINENLILLDMDLHSKEEIISCIADTLESDHRLIDKQRYIHDVYLREKELSTSMGSRIAIPHALSDGVKYTSLVFIRLQHPIQWDEDQVQMIFGIAVRKENKGNEHLKIISSLARKLMNTTYTESLFHSDCSKTCLKLLAENNIAA